MRSTEILLREDGRKYLPLSSFILPYKPTKLLGNMLVGKPLPHDFGKGD